MIDDLKRHEGLRLAAYKDSVGVLTIGYGRNLEGLTINEYRANIWLYEDANTATNEVLKALPWITSVSEVREQVIVNMCFNLGINGLLKFEKMLTALKNEDYETAADEMLDSKWAVQVGKRALELSERMRTNERVVL